MKIGFIGVGLMGSRMAANLVESAFEVYISNRTKKNAESLIDKGAKWFDSPEELASAVDIIITVLSSPEVVEKVAAGENGFLCKMNEGSIWIDCSTVNPKFSQLMASKAAKKGVYFLDAPVFGSLIPAEKGELTFLVGGEEKIIKMCMGLFNSMGKEYIHVGPNGMGSSLKLVINMLMVNSAAIFSEAVSLGTSLGIDKKTLINILFETPVVAPIVKVKKDNFENEDFPTQFPLKWAHKDLHLAALSAYEQKISMPITNASKELFALAKQNGYQELDFSSIFAFINHKEQNNENIDDSTF